MELEGFVQFIREQKMGDCVAGQLQLLRAKTIPTNADFYKLPENDLAQMLAEVLTAIQTYQLAKDSKTNLSFLDKRQLLGNASITHKYTFLNIQKLSLLKYAGLYFTTSKEALLATEALEEFYASVFQHVLEDYQSMEHAQHIKLLESEERYKHLFDNAHDLIHIVDPSGLIIYVNKAWIKTLGFTESEIKGQSVYSFVCPSDRDRFKNYRNQILAGSIHEKDVILCLEARDKKQVFVEGFLSAKFKDGAPVYTTAIFRDITARIENEEKLRYSNEQLTEREINLQLLIKYAPDAIIVIDAESNIALWNPKAEEVFGWKTDEVEGKLLADIIIPPSYRKAHAAGMQRYLSTGVAQVLNKTIEVTALNRSGKEFDISLTISHFLRTGKDFFVAFIRDIHQQKQNERELQQKRKELEESNKELEHYAWVTSHDLREPLRKILTFSDMVLTKYKDGLTAEMTRHITKISESAKRMSGLIRSMLLYSGISYEGNVYKPVSLEMVVTEVINDLQPLVTETNAAIQFTTLPEVEAVPEQMHQLFLNLMSNALTHIRPGTAPLIKISSDVVDQNHVAVHIQDNGIGFDTSHKLKIFQLFQRLSSGDKNGDGVGLAVSKKIVQNHKGTISVESIPNEGSTFTIVVPVKHA